jgi:pimeloyl-ACP methyl ester carboxylesterase
VSVELPENPRARRRATIWRWASLLIVAVLVVLVAYLGYVGYEGSRQLVDLTSPSADCKTPESEFGWDYDAINYDKAADKLVPSYPDPGHCPTQGPAAGSEVVAADGTHIAGWYIPAGDGTGPTGATVVLVHGHGNNKSDMLSRAELLHEDYNLVLFDFRAHGQSSGFQSTLGVLEKGEVHAVVNWLEETKAPTSVALLGISMGGAAAANEAADDLRIDALILESTHATLANAIQARLDREGYPLSLPAAWSVLMGGLIRTGQDMSAVDPIQAVERYADRPLLIVSGDRDDAIGRTDAQDLAAAGGADTELEICRGAGHAGSFETCRGDYEDWVLGFLARSLATVS